MYNKPDNQKEKEKCKGGECCVHGTRCNEFYPDGCHIHFDYSPEYLDSLVDQAIEDQKHSHFKR